MHGAIAGTDDAEPIRQALLLAREKGKIALRQRLLRAQQEGDLPAHVDCTALAAYVCAVVHGMAVQAKAGFPREKLLAISDFVLSVWPGHAAAPDPALNPLQTVQP